MMIMIITLILDPTCGRFRSRATGGAETHGLTFCVRHVSAHGSAFRVSVCPASGLLTGYEIRPRKTVNSPERTPNPRRDSDKTGR